MNVLLDTHIALWAITDDDRLSARAREMILSDRTTVWVSAASVWEIAIKHGLDRGDMPVSGQGMFDGSEMVKDEGFMGKAVQGIPLPTSPSKWGRGVFSLSTRGEGWGGDAFRLTIGHRYATHRLHRDRGRRAHRAAA